MARKKKETQTVDEIAATAAGENQLGSEQDVAKEQDMAQEVVVEADFDNTTQAQYELVKEIVNLFQPRIESGQLSPYQVAEALGLALSGTVYATVPEKHQKQALKEADQITNYLFKQFNHKSGKKNYMFASQLLGATRFTSYLLSHANNLITQYKVKKAQAANE